MSDKRWQKRISAGKKREDEAGNKWGQQCANRRRSEHLTGRTLCQITLNLSSPNPVSSCFLHECALCSGSMHTCPISMFQPKTDQLVNSMDWFPYTGVTKGLQDQPPKRLRGCRLMGMGAWYLKHQDWGARYQRDPWHRFFPEHCRKRYWGIQSGWCLSSLCLCVHLSPHYANLPMAGHVYERALRL